MDPRLTLRATRDFHLGRIRTKGFETLTFIEEGPLAHRDSTGGSHVSGPGGVQWMTAGSGIVHAEVSPPEFLRDGGPTHMLQLWMNLPAALKGTSPSYQSLEPEQLTTLEGEDWTWQIISGELQHHGGPLQGPAKSLTGLFTSRLQMNAGGQVDLHSSRRPHFAALCGERRSELR